MVDVYQHSGTVEAGSSDTSSDDELQEQGFVTRHSQKQSSYHGGQYSSGGVHPRFLHTQSLEEEEEKDREGSRKGVDPGPFRYNKRVFITALPCLLLTLAMTGEMLVLLVSVGGLVIVLMTHMSQEVGRKCVVMFALLFIPCQILVIGTILPLLWLSLWNVLVVSLMNMFCILTGGWVILQFAAFRKEEPELCRMMESGLFALYPFVCCAVVTWVLSTVVSTVFIPFVFLFLWFVYLQLYLMPAVSSFKQADSGDEDLSVLQQPVIIAIVLVFIPSGPAVHVVMTLAGTSPAALFSLSSVAILCELLCLGLFLSTLLSLRQLCDFVGKPHALMVQMRWGSGVGVVLLAYPTLQHLGMVSHFLHSLPLAVAAFAALGLALSLRRGKVLPLSLMVVVMVLMCLWLHQLPWTLSYSFLGMLPLGSVNTLVGVNFVLCLLAMFAAWHWSMELFGALLLLQSAVTTVCESGLYQAGLYPLPTYQLTGVVATYMLYRLHTANKIARNTAATACTVQLTKTTVGAVGYVRRLGFGEQAGDANVTAVDFVTMLWFVGMLVRLFVYEAKEEVTLSQMVKDITLLLVSMATASQSVLVPLGQLMLQTDPSRADLMALWSGVGGILTLLCALHGTQASEVRQQLTKVAGMMGVMGTLVFVMQPAFDLSLLSLYQGSEVVSLLVMGVVVMWGVEMGPTHTLLVAALLGLCPGLHAAWMLYGEEATVLHFVLITLIVCCLLAFLILITNTHNGSPATHNFIRIGTPTLAALVVGVLVVDLLSLPPGRGVWSYPGWRLAFGVCVCVSVALKVLAAKLGPGHLPMTRRTEGTVPVLPVMANVATVSAVLLARTQGPQDVLLHDFVVRLRCC
ncbi:uncharacterized protein LOC143298211 isoform X2 [Babylonia areolata]|uniref:uncharacterized protein LOC143298211 isoform X2 n=1 Tax=Babylonia areolata TaxID=304850 RepID=UPI003FD145FA